MSMRMANKYSSLIAKEYSSKTPNKRKIAKYARLGGMALAKWKMKL